MEKLTGRLRWEHKGREIRFEVPIPFRWAALPALLSAFCVPIFIDDIVRKSPLHGRGLTLVELLAACVIMMTILAVPALGSKRVVLLNREHLRFGAEALGKKPSHRTYPTSRLYDLRSNPVVSEWTGKEIPNQNTVEIGYGQSHRVLASRLTDAEAEALIAKMTEVFAFPKRVSSSVK